jgi:hypothetical protein
MIKTLMALLVCLLEVLVFNTSAIAEETMTEEPKRIEDNSFLIEEAYNQERGIVQHIQTFEYLKRANSWLYTFTQEWPVPDEKNQLSYTIPLSHFGEPSETGLGDILLNYRYQLVQKETVAVSPRFALILPTGDYKKGMGAGTYGYQVNIPLSMILSKNLVTHWNAGTTYTPGSKEPGGARVETIGYNLGASAVWLVSENFNLLTEVVWNSFQLVRTDGSKNNSETCFINPGMRFALNYKSGLQVVPGLAFPIGVGESKNEYGVFLYLSFEHPLF